METEYTQNDENSLKKSSNKRTPIYLKIKTKKEIFGNLKGKKTFCKYKGKKKLRM